MSKFRIRPAQLVGGRQVVFLQITRVALILLSAESLFDYFVGERVSAG